MTAADGTYTISGITPGTWNVREVAQAGWTCSFPARSSTRDVQLRRTLTGNDFGNWTTATKSGMKFYDHDADGSYEPGLEPQLDTQLTGWVIPAVQVEWLI